MKNGSYSLSLAMLLCITIVTSAVGATSSITVTIQGPSLPVHLGESVRIGATVTNVSKAVVHEGVIRGPIAGGLDYIVVLKDSQGRPVPHTELGKTVFGDSNAARPSIGSSMPVQLEPGDALEENIILTDLFDMTKIGSYSLIVKRLSPEKDDNNYISSNSITIEITR